VTVPRIVLLVLLLLSCAGLGVGVVVLSERGPAQASAPVPVSAPVTDGPVAVLREWDRARAAAWAAGDVRRLRSLYVAGSTAADADVARLRRWLARGARMPHLATQLLRAEIVADEPDHLVLAVTDRVVRSDGLPVDAPSDWRIALLRVADEWRVASVTR
jgi:hypothetical protein